MTIFAIRAYQGATKLLYWSFVSMVGFFLCVGVLTTSVFLTNREQCVILLGDLYELQRQERIFAEQRPTKK